MSNGNFAWKSKQIIKKKNNKKKKVKQEEEDEKLIDENEDLRILKNLNFKVRINHIKIKLKIFKRSISYGNWKTKRIKCCS